MISLSLAVPGFVFLLLALMFVVVRLRKTEAQVERELTEEEKLEQMLAPGSFIDINGVGKALVLGTMNDDPTKTALFLLPSGMSEDEAHSKDSDFFDENLTVYETKTLALMASTSIRDNATRV